MSEQKAAAGSRHGAGKTGRVLSFVRSSENYEKLADIKLKAGDYPGALVMLRRALEIAADKNTILFKTAEILTDIGCYTDALGFLAPLMDLNDDLSFEATRLLAFCYYGMYEFDAASDCFYRFLNYADVENYSPELLETVYDAADYCEQNSEADDETDGASDRPAFRDSSEIETERILNRAGELTREQNTDAVKKLLTSALKKYPASVPLTMMMMFTCYCRYDYNTGIGYYEKLSKKEREQLRALCIAAALYHGAGFEAKAQKCCELILDMKFETPEAYSGACSMMIEIGRYEDAAELAKKGLEESRYSKTLLHNYAKASYELGDYALAKEQYEIIAKLNFNDPIAAYYRNICRETLEDGSRRVINTDYALPSAQIIKRLRKIAELVGLNDKESEAIRLRWNGGDEELNSLINWAILDKDPKFSTAFVHLIAKLGGKRGENILRYILLDPYSEGVTKRVALGAVKAMELRGPFLVFYNGRMIEADVDIADFDEKKVPVAITNVSALLLLHVQDCSDNVKERAKKLIYEFALDYTKSRYELPEAQRSAFAVVLEYYARRGQGEDELEKNELIKQRGITERRFINAEYKLGEILKSALGEESDD